MARDSAITPIVFRTAAASAGTTTVYIPVGSRPLLVNGFSWNYETTEANADNTLKLSAHYTATDGTTFVALRAAPTNANGLLDTSGPLVNNVNMTDAASGGATAVAVTFTQARVPANSVLRATFVTAGTGTVPAINYTLDAIYV